MNTSGEAERRILQYLQGKRIHPAILLSGADQEERLRVAKRMAQFLFCKTASLCGECSNCRRVEKEIHPDFLLQKAEEDSIKIEQIRQICLQMNITPLEGGAKVCILEECDRMTSSAANALLKNLEEPGELRYFLLLTSRPNELLATVLSRCIQFSLEPVGSLLDETFSIEAEQWMQDLMQSKNPQALLAKINDKVTCARFVTFLQERVHESFTGRRAVPFTGLPPSKFALLSIFDELLLLEWRLRSNANYGLLVEDFLRGNLL